jgi:hypothetical protein
VTVFGDVADMFKRLVAALMFLLLLGLGLVAVVAIILLIGWLASGARF